LQVRSGIGRKMRFGCVQSLYGGADVRPVKLVCVCLLLLLLLLLLQMLDIKAGLAAKLARVIALMSAPNPIPPHRPSSPAKDSATDHARAP
jgi:hypothetical protein